MQAPAMAATKEEVKVEELNEEEEKLKKQNELEATTAAMIAMPFLESKIPALAAFLANES